MRVRDLIAAMTVSTLAGPGSLLALSPAVAATNAAQAAGPPIVGRAGTLTQRPPGQPSTSTAARQLKSATVTTRPADNRTQATVVLNATPTSAQNARLRLTLGELVGGSCEGQVEYSTPTYGSPEAGWSKSGTTYTLNRTTVSVYTAYDCAFAALTEVGGYTTTYDLLGGSLAPIYGKAQLRIESATLLGSKKLKLVPGVWTPIEVAVRNIGDDQAGRVVVSGAGKGVKVKAGRTSYDVYDGSTASITVQVKLKKKRKKTPLSLVAKGTSATKVTKTFKVKQRKAPARIKNGKYRSKDKRVDFRVKKGKIVGFRIYTMTTCGGYPNFPQYTWNHYSIPKTKIPKSGVVMAVERGSNYTARLEGLAAGGKLKKARFDYSGPNQCRASARFVAKRKGG